MEKSLFAQTGRVQGQQKEDFFSTSFQFTPSEEALIQTHGSLFVVVRLQSKDKDKALEISRQLFTRFKDKFYKAASSSLKILEETLEDLKVQISREGLLVDFVVANLWGSVLYLAKLGQAGAVLVRAGQAKKIDFTKVASGNLFDKDQIFLVDPNLLENADLSFFSKVVKEDDFEEGLAKLEEHLKEIPGLALGLRFSVREPPEHLQPLLIADLDKQEKVAASPWQRFSQKIALYRLAFKKPSLDFLENWRGWFKVQIAWLAPKAWELGRKMIGAILSPWLPRVPGTLEDESSRKRKRIIQVASLLVAILLLSLVAGSINRARQSSAERREKALTSLEKKLAEIEAIKNINQANAASLLTEAEKEIESLPAKDPKVASLRERLNTLATEVKRIFKVAPAPFADLTVLKGKIEAKKLKLAGGSLFVLDTGTGSVYKVETATKKASILVSEKKDLQNFTAAAERLFIQSKDGVRVVDIQTGAEKKLAGPSSKWKKLIAADTYRGNLYLLDSEAKQVWKYVPAGETLTGPNNYFVEDFHETPVGFAVDGSIWIASKQAVFKFFGGKKQSLEIKNLPQSYSEIAEIYTWEGMANLYIFDKAAGGIFVIEKSTGNYSGLYLADKLKETSSIVVDESKKIVYGLVGNTIYSFNLR